MEILDQGYSKKPENDPVEVASLKQELSVHKKHILNGKTALYVLIFLTVIGGLVGYFISNTELIYVAIELVIYSIFYAIALNIFDEKPKTALIITLSIFVFQIILNTLADPTLLFKGFIFKVAFFYFLVKGIDAAHKFETLKKKLEGMGETFHL